MSEEFARQLVKELDKKLNSMQHTDSAGYINPIRASVMVYRNCIIATMQALGHDIGKDIIK